MVKDRKAFANSLGPLLDLSIDRVVMAHGRVLDGADLERFQPVLRSAM